MQEQQYQPVMARHLHSNRVTRIKYLHTYPSGGTVPSTRSLIGLYANGVQFGTQGNGYLTAYAVAVNTSLQCISFGY